MPGSEPFDLQATFALVWNALVSVVCTIGFQLAVHGLIVAAVICLIALICMQRRSKAAAPLFVVVKKIAISCAVLAVPGAISLVTSGHLPPVNRLELNSFGLLGFWALVTAHFCMEEMNHQWFGEERLDPFEKQDTIFQ